MLIGPRNRINGLLVTHLQNKQLNPTSEGAGNQINNIEEKKITS